MGASETKNMTEIKIEDWGTIGYGQAYEKYDKDDYLPEKLKGKKYLKK